MTPAEVRSFTDAIVPWIEGRDDLRGLAMVGSWARGTVQATSDLDLVEGGFHIIVDKDARLARLAAACAM